uniref:Pyruvate dehydrogenase [NADP(+)], mitochondrial n=1 Tax=Euglena gracilis TaxID=3039 RepID=PNO_EUGGR|nr:RecName: Full=Pyruvate dehydrogenase [NADP(+)], mitochondrial; AltName: Full=Aquacobalamin reductase [NADPH]; AltName: Full=EgPNOmt; AltName: Full=Pyruvate:NADP(+) oxidoreductase; Flags: Precursor [Euglena gracilis]CAC37628.1 pyruvate:NADP+ oxidoreductase [Euglena gracilis]
MKQSVRPIISNVLRKEVALYSTIIGQDKGKEPTGRTYTSGPKPASHIEVPHHVTVPATDRTPNPDAQFFQSVDGSQATSHVAYALSDTAFIYPITPSSVMGELADVWMAQGRKNAFGQVVDVREMQSEAGAAGALHGALAAGAIATTFTASQGLLLMIPNMYKIAGELMPSVIHVAARELAGHALSIFGGHADVMAVRQTGWAMLCSHTVQQSHDMALISHVATLKSSIPFVHFFDGFRTSHEVNKIKMLPYAELKKLVPPGTMEQHWARSLNPMHPTIRGTNQSADIYFQNMESANQYYTDLAEVVQETMDEVAPYIGRHYKIFEYVGAPDAEEVTVLMGSGATTVNEAVDLLVKRGKKVGAVLVHLYRPWSTKAFEKVLPKTVKRIAALDRCKEVTALGEPLYLDVSATLNLFPERQNVKVIGGRYGLGSKDFIPEHALAIYANLASENPIQRFTVGITDDVTGTSVPFVNERVDTLPEGTRQCVFWGIGSDGTVGANRSAVRIIGDNSDLMVQAYFQFDAFKSGGVTSSHLRFGPKPITAQYLVTNADYIACHFQEYVKRFDMLDAIREGGTFVLNSRWTTEDMEKEIPADFRRNVAQKKVRFYNVDARKICDSFGLGKRINMLMQACFFKLSGVLPLAEAQRLLNESIVHEYGKKGGKVVEMNQAVVNAVFAGDLPQEVQVPAAWANAVDTSTRTPTGIEFVDKIMRPLMDFKGDQLPVSVMTPGGTFPVGTTQYAKRAIAAFIPQWIPANCTQCNYCSYVCPHATIRPFVLTDQEVQLAPESFVTRKAKGDYQGMNFRIQVAPEDCTGCQVCVETCPDDALEMTDAFTATPVQRTNWEFAIKVPNRGTMTDRYSLKGSQFQQPLLEFSGACEGCGETPYVKLLTQLFGERTVIANATGCSSIWGGTAGLAPYTTNAKGQGPAWGNSLFEDNAEFGFGIAVANAQKRSRVRDCILQAVEKKVADEGLTTLLAQWLQDWNTGDKTLKYQDQIIAGLAQQRSKDPLLEQIYGMKDMLPNISQWIIGGDGWANDIGFGGLDHVLASGQNLNVLVLDTEMYSNTGGQASKSTHMASVAKFALGGKRTNKKNLTEMAMSYGNVYVATVSHGNMAQCVKAFVEAESYDGPSLIVGYAPCIEHGLRAGMARMVQESEAAIATGYWPLYRFDPRLATEGKNPFQLDSKRIKGNLQEYLDRQNRYVNLKKNNPKGADLLKSQMADNITARFNRYRRMLEGPNTKAAAPSGNHVTILYGSETGNSEGLAKELATDFERREYSVAVQALDDIDVADLENMGFVVIAVSTCGQGQFPRNSQLFWRELQRDKPEGWLKNLKYTVFGLGDSTYYFYCHTAKQIDARLAALGAQRVVPIGFGDDGDEDMFHTGFNNWIPSVWNELKTKTPEEALFTPSIAVQLTPNATPQDFHFAKSTPVLSITGAERITPADHTRNFVTIRWKTDLSYQVGDSLGVFPENTRSVVEEFLQYYGLNPKDVITIENKGSRELPHCMAVGDLFTKVLDILGKPNNRFYKTLSYFAVDKAEKERLLKIAEMGPEYSNILSEMYHYADIFHMFPSARPTLQYLIEMIPNIKPRYYSISSAPIHTPGEVHSLVLIDTWITLSGKHRTGLTCTMLEHLQAGQVVDGCIHPTAMEFPDHEKPVVMCAMGSGLAPFVAFLRERSTLRKQGKKTGNMALYFGNRYEKTEFLMKEELKGHINDGLLTLRCAFSRDDPKKKVYVQDLIKMDEKMMYDYLVVQKGSMYCCGSRSFIKPVQESLKHCFMKAGGLTAEQAENEVIDMFTTGRYNIEAW